MFFGLPNFFATSYKFLQNIFSLTHVPIMLGVFAFIFANIITAYKRYKSNKVGAGLPQIQNNPQNGFNTMIKNPAMLPQKSK